MKYFATFIGIVACLLFSTCRTTVPVMNDTHQNTAPVILITVQFKNGWFALPDIMNVITGLASIRNIIIMENGFLFSEIQITCLRMPKAGIENIYQRIREIAGVANVIIKEA